MAKNDASPNPAESAPTTKAAQQAWGMLGNGAIFVPPEYGNTPWFPYAGLKDQMIDALHGPTTGAGGFQGNNIPMFNGLLGSDPNGTFGGGITQQKPKVGGGLLGTTAYSGGPNPFLSGFDPYAGRGNSYNPGAGGIGGPPGGPGTPPPGGPGAGPPITGPAPGSPAPRDPRTGVGGGPGGMVPPPGAPYQPPAGPGAGTTRPVPGPGNPYQQPGGPGAGSTRPGGLLSPPPAAGPSPRNLATQPEQAPAPKPPSYAVGQIQAQGTTPETSPQAMADYFMSLPPEQQGDYFNAISQYGLTRGQNLGGELDQALRAKMGASQFTNWLQGMDAKQASGIKSTQGLPAWLISGLGG